IALDSRHYEHQIIEVVSGHIAEGAPHHIQWLAGTDSCRVDCNIRLIECEFALQRSETDVDELVLRFHVLHDDEIGDAVAGEVAPVLDADVGRVLSVRRLQLEWYREEHFGLLLSLVVEACSLEYPGVRSRAVLSALPDVDGIIRLLAVE